MRLLSVLRNQLPNLRVRRSHGIDSLVPRRVVEGPPIFFRRRTLRPRGAEVLGASAANLRVECHTSQATYPFSLGPSVDRMQGYFGSYLQGPQPQLEKTSGTATIRQTPTFSRFSHLGVLPRPDLPPYPVEPLL